VMKEKSFMTLALGVSVTNFFPLINDSQTKKKLERLPGKYIFVCKDGTLNLLY
jgi:hypothetical protein